jgi:hypothetical protein
MKFEVHLLELHKPIFTDASGRAADGTEAIFEYQSGVKPGDLEPSPQKHLMPLVTDNPSAPGGRIEPGRYFFTQGTMTGDSPEEDYRKASEALWLESLWTEKPFCNPRIQVRILFEDGKRVFQVYRKIGELS